MKGEEVPPFEYRLITREGKKIDAILTTKLITYEGETAILGTVIDITARKKAEDEYLDMANLIDDIVVHVDKEGKWVFLNDGASEFWGKPKEKLMKNPFANYLHPDDQERTMNTIQEMVKSKKIVKGFVNRQKTPKGWRMVEWNAAPLFDEAGDYVGMQATGRDITEHKEVEESLKQSEEKYHSLVTNFPVDVWTIDSKDNPIFINPNVEKLFGFTPEEIRQRGNSFWHERTHPDDRERVKEAYNLFFTRRKTGDIEYRIQKKDGTWIWIHDRVMKVYEKDGVLYADGMTWEITEDKRTEK